MNAMTIPGFTAEASVSDTAGRYRMPAVLRRDALLKQWRRVLLGLRRTDYVNRDTVS
jgi:hypothetical protein